MNVSLLEFQPLTVAGRGDGVRLAVVKAVVKKVVRTIHTSTVEDKQSCLCPYGLDADETPRSAHFVYFPRVQAQRAESPQKPSLVSMTSEVPIGLRE